MSVETNSAVLPEIETSEENGNVPISAGLTPMGIALVIWQQPVPEMDCVSEFPASSAAAGLS